MMRWVSRVAIGLLVASFLSTAVRATEKDTPPKKDPAASAFALPSGLTLTPKETERLKSIRAELEPKLRDALKRIEQSTDEGEKTKAASDVREIKAKFKQAIDKILQDRAAKAREEYAKKVAEAKKKQAAANKNKNKKNGKRPTKKRHK